MCRSPAWPSADDATQKLLADAGERLRRAGADVTDLVLPAAFDEVMDAHQIVMQAESAASMGWEMLVRRAELSASLRERLEWGMSQPAERVDSAKAVLRKAREGFGAAIGDRHVLLTPSAPGEAPAGLEWTGDPAFNLLWTSLHVPCVTVPAGTGALGLPLGMQVVGRIGDDAATLAAAHWVGAALATV